jgi:hypothetical protein
MSNCDKGSQCVVEDSISCCTSNVPSLHHHLEWWRGVGISKGVAWTGQRRNRGSVQRTHALRQSNSRHQRMLLPRTREVGNNANVGGESLQQQTSASGSVVCPVFHDAICDNGRAHPTLRDVSVRDPLQVLDSTLVYVTPAPATSRADSLLVRSMREVGDDATVGADSLQHPNVREPSVRDPLQTLD